MRRKKGVDAVGAVTDPEGDAAPPARRGFPPAARLPPERLPAAARGSGRSRVRVRATTRATRNDEGSVRSLLLAACSEASRRDMAMRSVDPFLTGS